MFSKIIIKLIFIFTLSQVSCSLFAINNCYINDGKNNIFFNIYTPSNNNQDSLLIKNQDTTNIIIKDTIYYPAVDTIDFVFFTDTAFIQEEDTETTVLEYQVTYEAQDSMLFDFVNQQLYLFGEAYVKYGDIQLWAEYIEFDINTNEVLAHGMTDTLDTIVGRPVFKENEEKFVADTIRYNFDTKKGIIKQVVTKYEESFLHGGKTKLHPNRHVHLIDGKFTTCDLDHPHYYFNIYKAVVIPDDKIVSGPLNLVIADVPTPLGLPFVFFPNTDGGNSGVIIPEFGEEENRGFFLRNGGYYIAANEYFDLNLLGDFYSRGSWGLGLQSNYRVRYKFSGNFNFKYNKNVFGYRGLDNYETQSMYAVRWRFNQDPKARPNSSFSADVNMSSSAFDRWNSYSANAFMSNTKQSSISYSHTLPNTPFNLTTALRHTQNNRDSTIHLTLPDLTLSSTRIFPLKRREQVGSTKWYEKIGFTYTMNLTNQIKSREDSLLHITRDNLTNGISHRIPISTSFSFLNHTTLTPSFNYQERWYFRSVDKEWIEPANPDDAGYLQTNFINRFERVWDYSTSLNWNTRIYGTFYYNNRYLKALRHVISPSIAFSYRPDFGDDRYGYYDEYYRIMYNSNTGQYDTVSQFYSRFEAAPYGVPQRGGGGSVNFNLGNNLEAKVRSSSADTAQTYNKISILESLNFSTNYNIMADSLNWAPINMSGRTRINFLDINFSSVFDPYAIAENPHTGAGMRVNKSEFSETGNLFRLTSANVNLGFSLNSSRAEPKELDEVQRQNLWGYPEHYVDFDIPWNVRISYSLRYSKPYYESNVVQTLNFSGDFSLTDNWKISFSSGYDLKNNKASYTTIDIYRDLHCWEASLHIVPFGSHKSYMFQINVKADMLKDLKLSKRRSWFDNF